MALSGNIVWECNPSATAGNVNGGGFRWVNLVSTTYAWTLSGSGTNEYYCRLAALTDPSLTKASVYLDGNFNLATEGTVGSLTAGQWDYGDNDALGYSTIYVRLSDGADPDTKPSRFVGLGFNGGTDYSQGTTAHLTITDLASDGAGGVSSVLTPFDAADAGNILHITAAGTGFTVGWYEVQSVAAGVATLDTSPGASKTGGTAYLGGAMSLGSTLDSNWMIVLVARNIAWIHSGNYTLGESSSAALTTATLADPIKYIGYNTTRGDNPTGINRPYINFGAYYVRPGGYTHYYNLICTGTANAYLIWSAGNGCVINNCLLMQTSSTANYEAVLWQGSGCKIINTELVCVNGYGVNGACNIYDSYIHHCNMGATGAGFGLEDTIFYYCTTNAFYGNGSSLGTSARNCTFYGDSVTPIGTGLNFPASGAFTIMNNIFYGLTSGITKDAVIYDPIIENNNFYNNTTDVTFVAKGKNCIAVDPAFTNAEGTLISNCETAWNEYTGTGVTATADGAVYKVGTYSAKAACTAATGVEIVMTKALASTNMSGYKGISCWARSSVALAASDWALILSDQANGANILSTLNFPAMAANTWYHLYLYGGDLSTCTAIISIGIKQLVDKGAMNFNIDDVRACNNDFSLQTGSGCIDTGSHYPEMV